jgi:hypothetical protein
VVPPATHTHTHTHRKSCGILVVSNSPTQSIHYMTLAASCFSFYNVCHVFKKVRTPTRRAWASRQVDILTSAFSSSRGQVGFEKPPINDDRVTYTFERSLSYGTAPLVLGMGSETATVLSSNFLSGLEKDPNLILIVLNWYLSPWTARIWNCGMFPCY